MQILIIYERLFFLFYFLLLRFSYHIPIQSKSFAFCNGGFWAIFVDLLNEIIYIISHPKA